MRPRRQHRPLRLVLRSPAAHWVAAAILGLLTFTTLQARSTELDRRADALGPTRRVVVATDDLNAGDVIGPDSAELRTLPVTMVPESALDEMPDDLRLRVAVDADEVIVDRRLTGRAASPLAAAIPNGCRAIAVPMSPGALAVEPGDRVDVLAPGAGRSTVVTADALVIASTHESATIAVADDDVAAVADAVLAATFTLALAGAG